MTTIKIEKTLDFGKFKKMDLNRTIMKVHVNNLKESIINNPNLTEISPIVVNRSMEVVDGQHRLEAHRQLEKEGFKYPIHYIIREGFDVDVAKQINSVNKPWIGLDFARAEAEKNENYKIYMEAHSQTGLPHPVIVTYLTSGDKTKGTLTSFRKGKFEVKDLTKALLYFQYLSEIGEVIQNNGFGGSRMWKSRNFGLAIYNLFKCSNYDHQRMIEMLKLRGDALASSKKTLDIESVLKSIYNRGINKKLS